jgi:hypothetical protein
MLLPLWLALQLLLRLRRWRLRVWVQMGIQAAQTRF